MSGVILYASVVALVGALMFISFEFGRIDATLDVMSATVARFERIGDRVCP